MSKEGGPQTYWEAFFGSLWRKHVYFYAQFSFLCVVDESLKKTSGFASCVHHNLSVCVCVCSHESARVTYTTYIIDDFELKRSSIEVKKLT